MDGYALWRDGMVGGRRACNWCQLFVGVDEGSCCVAGALLYRTGSGYAHGSHLPPSRRYLRLNGEPLLLAGGLLWWAAISFVVGGWLAGDLLRWVAFFGMTISSDRLISKLAIPSRQAGDSLWQTGVACDEWMPTWSSLRHNPRQAILPSRSCPLVGATSSRCYPLAAQGCAAAGAVAGAALWQHRDVRLVEDSQTAWWGLAGAQTMPGCRHQTTLQLADTQCLQTHTSCRHSACRHTLLADTQCLQTHSACRHTLLAGTQCLQTAGRYYCMHTIVLLGPRRRHGS